MNDKFDETLAKTILFCVKIRNWIRKYLYFSNFDKKHVTYGFVNGKFLVSSTNHEDFIVAIQNKINRLSKTNDRVILIRLSLTEALTGCNFVIFSPIDQDNLFVQFWTGEHHLKFNFCYLKTNGLKRYFYSILGLLGEYGFVNKKFITGNGKGFYEVEESSTMTNVYADFETNIEIAAEFTAKVFNNIYKIGPKKLEVKVE